MEKAIKPTNKQQKEMTVPPRKYSIKNSNDVESVFLFDFHYKNLIENKDVIQAKGLSVDFIAFILTRINYAFITKTNKKIYELAIGKNIVRIDSTILSKKDTNYQAHIQYCIDEHLILLTDKFDKSTHKSNGYGLVGYPETITNKSCTYSITEIWLVKQIKKQKEKNNGMENGNAVGHPISTKKEENICVRMNKEFVSRITLKKDIDWAKFRAELYTLACINFPTNPEPNYTFYLEVMTDLKNGKLTVYSEDRNKRTYDALKNIISVHKSCFVWKSTNQPLVDLDEPNSQPTYNFIHLYSFLNILIKKYNTEHNINKYYPIKNIFKTSTNLIVNNQSEICFKNETHINITNKQELIQTNLYNYSPIIHNLISNKHNRTELNNKHYTLTNYSTEVLYVLSNINVLTLLDELKSIIDACLKGKYYELFYKEQVGGFENVNLDDDTVKYDNNVLDDDFTPLYKNRDEAKNAFMLMLNDVIQRYGKLSSHWDLFSYHFPQTAKFWSVCNIAEQIKGIGSYGDLVVKEESKVREKFITKLFSFKDADDMIYVYEIHDGFLVRCNKEDEVKRIFINVTRDHFKETGLTFKNTKQSIYLQLEKKKFKPYGESYSTYKDLAPYISKYIQKINSYNYKNSTLKYFIDDKRIPIKQRYEQVFNKKIDTTTYKVFDEKIKSDKMFIRCFYSKVNGMKNMFCDTLVLASLIIKHQNDVESFKQETQQLINQITGTELLVERIKNVYELYKRSIFGGG